MVGSVSWLPHIAAPDLLQENRERGNRALEIGFDQKFRKGVGGQRGLVRGNPSPGTQFWDFCCFILGRVSRQLRPANPFSEPSI